MTAFIAVDWGSTSFRAWSISAGGQVLAESRSAEGMLHCAGSATGFAPVLQAHLARLAAPADSPVLICGMAGARQGWIEAPYATLPAPVAALAGAAVRVPAEQTEGRDVRILPGLAQQTESDVMRGEETQLLGLALAGHQGLACMPGTHCKWALLQNGQVAGFHSYLTGELFDLLSRHSILRHAMPESLRIAPDDPAFLAALDLALADPAALFGALFGIRAAELLGTRSKAESAARLSGLLIGAEVGCQLRAAEGQAVVLVGQAGLGALYAAALHRAGLSFTPADAEEATRAGLIAAAREIWGTAQ